MNINSLANRSKEMGALQQSLGPAKLTMLQGLDHAVKPGYDRVKVARTSYRK